MATKKQEVLLEEQAPMGEATPHTEGNPELEEMHDATDAESPPPQTGTEMSETDGNSADPGSLADAEEASPQTETEGAKKTRGRKKTAEKTSESDAEADSDDKNAGDGALEAPKLRRRRASARPAAVVSIDERPTVETEADKAKNDLLDLLESQKTGRILTGTIQGVERPADNPSRSLAVIYHGEFKVMIPAEEAVEPPADYRGRLPEDVLHYMLTKRLGAEVDYIVKGIDPKSGLAVASRLEAMKAKRKAYYLGLEIYIPLRELSYQRWMDAAIYFQPGQRILVKVLEVDRSDRNQIKATASVKQAGENPYEKALRRYSVGNRYVGTVSMVDTNGVFVALDGGIDCLCSYPKRGRPPRGSRVTVRILGINNDSNRIWGAITHIAAAR